MVKKWPGMIAVVLLLAMVALGGCAGSTAQHGAGASAARDGTAPLTIQMLDVGQGDALLIRTAEQTVMIDTGDVDERDKLRAALKKAGVTTIDKLIITHPHADHMGGADVLFQEFEVRKVYDNGQPTTSKLYRSYLKTIKDKKIDHEVLAAGKSLDFGGGVSFKVLSPTGVPDEQNKDLNNNSIVGRLAFGDFSMLFTGDSQAEAEMSMVKFYGKKLKSTILKAPHHGSRTSSSAKYLDDVAPEAVLISLGAGNEYGHPHKVTLERYAKRDIKVYRTDQNGTITITSDGSSYKIEGEK